MKKFLNWLRSILNAGAVGGTPPVVVNNPQPSPAPPSVEPLPLPAQQTGSSGSSYIDAINIAISKTISKYVKNIPAMPVAGELRNVNLLANRVTFETSDESWISKEWGRIAIVFRDADGTLIVGEFDARRPGQRAKGLENIHGGYIQNKKPQSGVDFVNGMRVAPGEKFHDAADRKSTRLNSSHVSESRMPSSA